MLSYIDTWNEIEKKYEDKYFHEDDYFVHASPMERLVMYHMKKQYRDKVKRFEAMNLFSRLKWAITKKTY